jgi:hypothetical protein
MILRALIVIVKMTYSVILISHLNTTSFVTRVKLAIIEHIPIIKHFSIFSKFLSQIEQFLCYRCTNWRVTNVHWMSEVMEQQRKHKKRMSNSFVQFFWKHSSRTLSSSSSISSSILVCFEWFKTWWVCQLGLYKTSLYSASKDATIENLKLEIIICFKSPITKHWGLLHKTPHILLIPLLIWNFFMTLEMLGGRLKMFFQM